MSDEHSGINGAWLDISETLLDRLRGRINVLQPQAERHQFIVSVLNEICLERERKSLANLSTDAARQEFLKAFLSYEQIDGFLADPNIEDIMINGTDPIFVHRAGQGLVKTPQRFAGSRELAAFVKKLIVFSGRTELQPINDIELLEARGRVNIALSPFGPQITITRAKERPLSILELIDSGTITFELAGQLWIYVEGLGMKPANLIIAGGPGAGKTTLLNALLSFVPEGERLVMIEDTLELNASFLENCSRLESAPQVTMETLVKNSLRMRPDRIVVGEVRGGEARDLMTAINIGKYCMGTVHASTARETVIRLQNEPMNVPEMLVNLVDVFIVIRRFNLKGKVFRSVVEVVETAGLEKKVVLLSQVWTFDYQRMRVGEASPSSVFRDRLAQASGLNSPAIMNETARRVAALQALHAKGVREIADVTQFCTRYIRDPQQTLASVGIV